MARDRRSATDPMKEIVYGGGIEIGTGDAPDGRWRIRALARNDELYLHLDLWNEHDLPARGGGVGGVGLANSSRPVVISMSRPGPTHSYCYIGQAIDRATRIEMRLTNGSAAIASLIRPAEIPVQLWIVFLDGTAGSAELHAFADNESMARIEITDEWPWPPGNICWGPIDD